MARRHREIVSTLLDRILDGTHPPGSALPKEEAIATEFDVARGTAREALRALEERRVARVKHGRGATVLDPAEWNVLDPEVAQALLRGRGRRKVLDELTEVLRLLEPEAAALAAERATPDQLRALTDALNAGDATTTRAMAEATGNRPLAATLRSLHDLLEAKLATEPEGDRALAEALERRDAAAAREAARRRLV